MNDNELAHFGILGMKWGVRKNKYRSTGIKSLSAKRQNEKIDKSFREWEKNDIKKANAISSGKKANLSRLKYEHDTSDAGLKKQYKSDKKEYKKLLRSNTTYRKGDIKSKVGSDISRKYLSEAKKIKKQINENPTDKSLVKNYNRLMSKHAIERAKARKAPMVANKRMLKIASIKRTMTMSTKAAITAATIAEGTYIVNKYLKNHNTTLNGQKFRVDTNDIREFNRYVSMGRALFKFF